MSDVLLGPTGGFKWTPEQALLEICGRMVAAEIMSRPGGSSPLAWAMADTAKQALSDIGIDVEELKRLGELPWQKYAQEWVRKQDDRKDCLR